MTIRRNVSLALALALAAAACTNGSDETQDTSDTSTVVQTAAITCTATGGLEGISVLWEAEATTQVQILRDGSLIATVTGGFRYDDPVDDARSHDYTLRAGPNSPAISCGSVALISEVGQPTCSVELDTFAVISWELSAGRAEVFRNGERVIPDRGGLTSPFIDTAAPTGIPLAYEVTAVDSSGQELPSKTAPCGTVTVEQLPPDQALLQIAQADARLYRGPYGYVTVVPICPECETEKVDIYYAFDNESRVPLLSWRGEVEAEPTDDIWFTDPLAVPTLLLEALANGDEITSVIDPDSGLIVQWTVNGRGAILDCLELDMAPLESRQKDCGGSIYRD